MCSEPGRAEWLLRAMGQWPWVCRASGGDLLGLGQHRPAHGRPCVENPLGKQRNSTFSPPQSSFSPRPRRSDAASPLKIMMDRRYLCLCLPVGQYGSPFCPSRSQVPLLQREDCHPHWHSYFLLVLSCQTASFVVETCGVCVDAEYDISMCFLNPSGFWSSQHTDRNVKLIMLKILLIFLRCPVEIRNLSRWVQFPGYFWLSTLLMRSGCSELCVEVEFIIVLMLVVTWQNFLIM